MYIYTYQLQGQVCACIAYVHKCVHLWDMFLNQGPSTFITCLGCHRYTTKYLLQAMNLQPMDLGVHLPARDTSTSWNAFHHSRNLLQ